MSSSEPCPRKNFFSFERHSSGYVWGGQDDRLNPVDDLIYLYEFKYTTGAWARHQLKGQHPPGIHSGCCARVQDCVYFYGGKNKSNRETGSLFELNLTTLTWQELSHPGRGSPSKKYGCCMIDHKNTLVIYGGMTGSGHTNETHIFEIATGTWSSPQVTGDVPEPDSNLVFCKVSQNKVVQCGGLHDEVIYVLDVSTMHWTKVRQSGPLLGFSFTATCIGYDSDHAQLLIIGRYGVYMLDVTTWEFKKLHTDLLPGGKELMRLNHSATILSSTPTSVEILIFGGQIYVGDKRKGTTISSAILLILKKKEDDKWWRITDIIKGDELRERSISYSYGSTSGEKESAAEVQHVEEDEEIDFLREFYQPDSDICIKKKMSSVDENEFPPLPVMPAKEVNEDNLPKFTSKKNVSVIYKGKKGSLDWKENGLQLQFEEQKESLECDHIPIHIATVSGSYSRFPNKVKPVSRVYRIHCLKQLNTSVTIRIQHNAPIDAVHYLSFFTCKDDQPPYDYQLVHGGTFTSDYGEIVVSKFSRFTIGRFFSRYIVRGILSLLEKSYEASLYRSVKPHLSIDKQQYCNIYVSVVRNCNIFKVYAKDYVKVEYGEDVKLVKGYAVHFNDTDQNITVEFTSKSDEVCLNTPDRNYLHKEDISRYVDGCPPHLKYTLHYKPNCSLEVKFKLEGLEDLDTLTLHSSDLPDVPTSNPMMSSYSDRQENQGTLCDKDLNGVFGAICGARVKWEYIGLGLGVDYSTLQVIKSNRSGDTDSCCLAMLHKWLTGSSEKSWNALADAIESGTVGYPDLAKEVRKRL